MNKRYISIIVGLILILGIGGFVYSSKDNDIKAQSTDTPRAQTGSNTTTEDQIKSYSQTEVASHSTKASCWSIINGNVYDLTSWIPNHPGGERAILSICGVDGSGAFNGQHGGNSKIAGILAGFKIGVLK